MHIFEDLPDELLDIIISYFSTIDKINIRATNNICNKLINYMHIKIDKFDERYQKVLIPFRISDTITQYMSIGLITEWQSQFCWHLPRKRSSQQRTSKILTQEKIRESIYEVGSVYASVWLYEAIKNWSIVENDKYQRL